MPVAKNLCLHTVLHPNKATVNLVSYTGNGNAEPGGPFVYTGI